jgi:diguanylate cyclase (GGDEF)-like protein
MIITPVQTDRGEISHFVAIKHDITEQLSWEERLKFLASHDLLTSLPNRGLLHDRLEQAIARAKRNHLTGAVLYLDLDNFKQINDAYSHEEGDLVLTLLAQRMMVITRETDTVARLSGDEFAILLEDVQDRRNVSLLTERLLYEISKPIQLEHTQAAITASIGIAMFPKDGEEISTLLQNADVAMYYGKSKGKNSYVFFNEEMKKSILMKASLGRDLRSAVANSEFILEYQPVIDLTRNQITGAEALIRWQHPEQGIIYPNDFIQLAEDSNLIVPIGEWVMQKAISVFQNPEVSTLHDLRLSLNLSRQQLLDDDHFDALTELIRASTIDPARLQLEITETSIFENLAEASQNMRRLRKLGVKLAIDDFGTGYSSLSYLEQFPVDTIKIDIAFIRRITYKEIELPILKGIISIAHEMGMEVVAEGVETQAQLAYLKKHGCNQVQGFYLHTPMSEEELVRVVESQ